MKAVGVRKEFRGAHSSVVLALDDVSFVARQGEFLCIIGPSGCGKSTLLNLITALDQPTAGVVEVYGKSPDQARRDRQIGLVFQDPVLLPWRTVVENIALPLEVVGLPRAERRKSAGELARFVGLEQFVDAFPHQLSGGMQQRVGIARALSHDPPLLLMDEPFGALDAITRDRMNVELLSLWIQRQKTIVFVTHSLEEAVFLSDTILVMSPHPGSVLAALDNPLPRPRDLGMRDTREFASVAKDLRALLEQP